MLEAGGREAAGLSGWLLPLLAVLRTVPIGRANLLA